MNNDNQETTIGMSQAEGMSVGDFLASDQGIATSNSVIMTANDTIRQAKRKPKAENLWRGMIFENECTVIFSDSNVGKSILAVQIGIEIAQTGRNVLYMDYEMSELQFTNRYTHSTTRRAYRFPETFFRAQQGGQTLTINAIDDVKECISAVAADVVIIDNITWLANETECGDVAGQLMIDLINLKRTSNLTLIIIAHTPKRQLRQVLTQNDLGGSKKIMNFVDSAIGMSKCVSDPELRYIKNIKNRSAAIEFGENRVLLCRLTRAEMYCHFEFVGTATERECLKTPNPERDQLIEEVKRRRKAGESQRAIALDLGMGVATINRMLKE